MMKVVMIIIKYEMNVDRKNKKGNQIIFSILK